MSNIKHLTFNNTFMKAEKLSTKEEKFTKTGNSEAADKSEMSEKVDRFELCESISTVGYQRFAAYRKISDEMSGDDIFLPETAGKVPSPVTLAKTIDSIGRDILNGNDESNPDVLIDLYKRMKE